MPLNDANIFNTRIDAQQYLRRQTTIQKYGAIAIICVCPYALINMYLNFDLFSDMRVYLTSMVWMLTAITASCAWTVAILCLKRNSKKYVVWIIGGYLGIAWSMMVMNTIATKLPFLEVQLPMAIVGIVICIIFIKVGERMEMAHQKIKAIGEPTIQLVLEDWWKED